MNLNRREAAGLLLIVAGLVLMPVAWAFSRLLWALCGVLLAAGVLLFYTERRMRREAQLSRDAVSSSGSGTGSPVPNDIYNYTGWRSGGRSETMDSALESGAGDGD